MNRYAHAGAIRALAPALALAVAASTALGGDLVYVDVDASSPRHDGTSWCTAYTSLSEALTAATAGTTIRIAEGVYVPDPAGLDDPRDATFLVPAGVTLMGGHAGCGAPDPDERDPALHATVLSGDLAGDDAPDFGGRADNTFHVVALVEAGDAIVLDGLTIRGGHADGPNFGPSPESRDQGGGLNNYFSRPTVIGCTFTDNFASNHGALNDHGGATVIDCVFDGNRSSNVGAGLYIHFDEPSSVTGCTFTNNVTEGKGGGAYNKGNNGDFSVVYTDCSFIGNVAAAGGGMYCDNGAIPTIIDCEFIDNVVPGNGGGLHCANGSDVTVDGCYFEGNVGDLGGGSYCDAKASPGTFTNCVYIGNDGPVGGALYTASDTTITGCLFEGNTSELGGGVYTETATQLIVDCDFIANDADLGGGFYDVTGAPILIGCRFYDNTCDNGGGVYNEDNTAIVIDCDVAGNLAIGGDGGAGIYNLLGAPTIIACTVTDNATVDGEFPIGGGVLNYFSAPTITNCTIVGNHSDFAGGGVYLESGDPVLINCLIADNTAGEYGGGIHLFGSSPQLTNCTLADNTAGIDGGGLNGLFFCTPVLTNCILWDNAPSQVTDDELSSSTIESSNVMGGWPGGTDIIDEDPLFVADDDWRLGAGSPCIDAGNTAALPPDSLDLDDDGDTDEPWPIDLDGAARVTGTAVDMGCYERPLTGDLDRDGDVDGADLGILLGSWGPCPDCPADLDGDGDVDGADLGLLLGAWS